MYDGRGNRTEKAGLKFYWCGLGSQVLDESDTTGNVIDEVSAPSGGTGNWTRQEIYAGGRHLATFSAATGQAYWDFTDWLGTERARASAVTGAVVETCTSLPWGDNLQCTGTDQSPLHFTGKQRDTESGLDNFEARYLASSFGRFMSPDWSGSPNPDAVPYADLPNPQSLNLYSYARNNPTSATDPNGHCDIDGEHHNWFWCLAHTLGLEQTVKEQADAAREDLSTGKNFTINGQSPADFAKNASNQEVIAARRAVVEFLLGKMSQAMQPCPQEGMSCGVVFPFDFAIEGDTENWSATFQSEGDARAFARTKLGSDPMEVEPGKWRSRDGKWQYRAKAGDINDPTGPHIHLEELDPKTGQVIQNVHLRWPEGTGRE